MADDRQVNEVIINGETVVNLRKDTVAENNLMEEETATNHEGRKIEGEFNGASEDDAYLVSDPIADIEEEDYIPFNDISDTEMPKKKTLFSDIIGKLADFFISKRGTSGNYTIDNDSQTMYMKHNKIDASKVDNNVTSTTYPSLSNILDKDGRIIMRTEAVVNPDGRIGWKAYINNYDTDGTRIAQRGLKFYEDKTGAMTFEVDDPRAFRKAINSIDQLGASLPRNTVIDDYHADSYTGTYYFGDDGVASTIVTLPEAVCGKLIVANNGNGGFSQYYIPNHSVRIWVRVWWNNAWSAWQDLASGSKPHTYDIGEKIPQNSDLNTYITCGTYYVAGNADAETMSNLPYPCAGKLLVLTISNDSSNNPRLYQLYFSVYKQYMYSRFRDFTGNWTAWNQFAMLNDIIPSAIGGGYAEGTVNGSAITATISGFKLLAGGIVSIKLSSEVTSACTLNISNTGAKSVVNFNDETPSVGNALKHGINTFIYDGTVYRFISRDRTPSVGVQNYVADTSGNVLIDWGYSANRAQIKHNIGANKLNWNYYKNSAWRGDLSIADYDDIVHQTFGKTIPDNADLNNYTTNGIYNIGSTSRARTISNMPCGYAGKLIVMRVAANQYVKQIFIPYDSLNNYQGFYERTYNGDTGGGWRGWRKFVESNDGKIELYQETTTAEDKYVGISAKILDTTTAKSYSRDVLKIYQDHQSTPYGLNLILDSGGNTVIGSGEAGTSYYPILDKTKENLHLVSEVDINLFAKADNVANRIGLRLDTNGRLVPINASGLADNLIDLGLETAKYANLWVYKINGSTPITADNVIVSNQNIGSSSAIDSLDDIPLNTAGRVNITASLSPCGVAGNYAYIYYGINNGNRVIELTRTNHGSKNTEEKWYQAHTGTSWTGWMPLSRQGTYVGTCTTEANQRAKVATVDDDFSLKKGVRVAIKFSNTNTYSSSTSSPVTLNVNDTGAKNIYYNNTHSGAGNTGTNTRIYGIANRYVFYIYDGTYWVWDSHSCDDNSTNFLRNDASSILTASGSAYLDIKSSTIDLTQANNGVESTQYPAYIIQDKNGYTMSRLECIVETDGGVSTYLQVRNYKSDGTNPNAGIKVKMDKNGTLQYSISQANKFNAAIGIGYGTCTTAADQRVKVVTLSNFVLTVGGIIGVKFTYTNTYSATADNKVCLNVNGTGEKPIYYNTGYPTGTNTTAFGIANRVHYYMYDGTNWCWLNSGCEDNTVDPRQLGSGYGTCDTAAATAAKVVTMSNYTLRTGGILSVKFTNAVPANATMNINSRGAKNIWYRGANVTANVIQAGDLVTFVYDGTRYQILSNDRWGL